MSRNGLEARLTCDSQAAARPLIGGGENQPGPELAASGWYVRSLKIFNKLAQVTWPGERGVVVHGAGHLPWLRELVERTPGFVLEEAM